MFLAPHVSEPEPGVTTSDAPPVPRAGGGREGQGAVTQGDTHNVVRI